MNAIRGEIPSLTALRGIAALWVFVYHAWVSAGPQRLIVSAGNLSVDLTPLASVGWAGVDIFYVLSGYLLWATFASWARGEGHAPSIAHYARRRALRILPPYYAQLALFIALGATTTLVPRPPLADILAHVALIHSWRFEYVHSINGVWWTLSYEAQYYALLPILAYCIRRAGWIPVFSAGMIVMLTWRIGAFLSMQYAPLDERIWLIEQLPGRIDQFLIGMLTYHATTSPSGTLFKIRQWVINRRLAAAVCVAAGPVVLISLAYLLHVHDYYISYWNGSAWLFVWHTVAAIGIGCSIYGLTMVHLCGYAKLEAKHKPSGLARSALMALGTISYSFYLWHEPILRWISAHLLDISLHGTWSAFGFQLCVGFVASAMVASLWYLAFERPFMKARPKRVKVFGKPAEHSF